MILRVESLGSVEDVWHASPNAHAQSDADAVSLVANQRVSGLAINFARLAYAAEGTIINLYCLPATVWCDEFNRKSKHV